jgi:hypothetical protein
MTISSVGGTAAQTALSQIYGAQQAQAAAAVSVDSPSATPASANNLTGSTVASLDSQTLQALLGLTQEDPADPSAQPGTASQTPGQTQGAHRHHHHHGGGMQMPQDTTSSAVSVAGDPTASTIADSQDSTDASLESALMAA